MRKNHYVSKLIIKRFPTEGFDMPIDVFDLNKYEVLKDKKADKIFQERGLFDDDVETMMGDELEQPFALLLDKKIIGKDKIQITRAELFLIKRFLILDSVKTYSPEQFFTMIEMFESCTEQFLSMSSMIKLNEIKKLPKTKDMRWSPRELQMNAMRMYIRCKQPLDRLNDELCTQELFCWAWTIDGAYLTFCDSADGQEFLLSSTGMISENEPSFYMFADGKSQIMRGLNLSKFSYLQSRIEEKECGKTEIAWYKQQMAFRALMYENFNIFNLSSTRCIVLVHPFFKLYNEVVAKINGEIIRGTNPDIWPSRFETKAITKTPDVIYKTPPSQNPDDVFSYNPAKLSLFDTILVNYLILSSSHKMVGFSNIEKISDSICCKVCLDAHDDKRVYDEGIKGFMTLLDNIEKHKLNKLIMEFPGAKHELLIDPLEWCEKFGQYACNDTFENPYVIKYLLSQEEYVREEDNIFGFMGTPDERIRRLKDCLKHLEK